MKNWKIDKHGHKGDEMEGLSHINSPRYPPFDPLGDEKQDHPDHLVMDESGILSTRESTHMVTVSAGARLHFGFANLSLAHARLYGGVGVALENPRVAVRAEPAAEIDCPSPVVREFAVHAVELLDVPGVSIRLKSTLPQHVGLGSGTATALATLSAIAHAYDRKPKIRERAPDLGRGGRSGVGVACFEAGGLVVDAGHPTELFTANPPERGEWSVPSVVARHHPPDDWRFVLALPDADPGRSDDNEDESMRAVIERADPALADELAGVLTRRLLPAVAGGRVREFGAAVERFGRLNGAWYADEQGGVYRPPVGQVVKTLSGSAAVEGVGQSSWGPAVYAVTDATRADDAQRAARDALDSAGTGGNVRVVGVGTGARVN